MHFALERTVGQTEVFNNAVVTFAAYRLFGASLGGRNSLVPAIQAAAALGFGLQIKYVVFPEAALLCLGHLAALYRKGCPPAAILGRAGLLVLAGCLPTALAVGYFWSRGALQPFVSANVGSNLAYLAIEPSFAESLRSGASGLAPVAGCIAAIIAAAAARGRRRRPHRGHGFTPEAWIALWAAAAALDICMPLKFSTHYFFALYPPLCLGGALALAALAERRPRSLAIGTAALLLSAAPPWIIATARSATCDDTPRIIAGRLRDAGADDGSTYVYDYQPAIYALAHIAPPTRFVLTGELGCSAAVPVSTARRNCSASWTPGRASWWCAADRPCGPIFRPPPRSTRSSGPRSPATASPSVLPMNPTPRLSASTNCHDAARFRPAGMRPMSAIEGDVDRPPTTRRGGTFRLPRPGTRALAFLWTAGESAARQIMGLGLSLAVLAFVTPHDLGVYSIAFSIVLVLALIVDDPVSEALIQRPIASTRDWDTGFTVNLAIACGMVAIAAAVSFPVAGWLAVPELRTALPVLACCIIAGALGNIHRSHLTRELRFPVLVKISVAANLAGGAGALALAVAGYGYWAMIAGTLITNAAGTVMYRHASSWRPRLRISLASLRSLSGFAGQSFAAHCVLLMREGALPIILGYASTATDVGYFSLALRISRTLGLFFEEMTRRPLFTLMSRLAQEPQRAASFLLNLIAIVGAVALPAFAGLALLGPDAAVLVFGAKWTQAGHLMPLLCAIVFGWFTLHVPAVAMRARGDAERAIWLLAVPTVFDLVLFVALLPAGLETALIGMTIRAAVTLPLLAVAVRRRLGVPGRSILARWALPLLGICCMTLCIGVVRPLVGAGWSGMPVLLIAGALSYVSVLTAGWLLGDRRLYRH